MWVRSAGQQLSYVVRSMAGDGCVSAAGLCSYVGCPRSLGPAARKGRWVRLGDGLGRWGDGLVDGDGLDISGLLRG